MPKLYLLPSSLGEDDINIVTPTYNIKIIASVHYFACENIRSARRFLIRCGMPSPIPENITFIEIRNDEDQDGLNTAKEVLLKHDLIYLSEAGNPCIADPGEALVNFAHHHSIKIKPLVGASSILLALIASGFNGEQFTFHGYIPRDKHERSNYLKQLLNKAKSGYTQIFMDTPYRNNQVLEDLISLGDSDQYIAIAANLCCPNEVIIKKTIKELKGKTLNLHKQPCIFLIGSD